MSRYVQSTDGTTIDGILDGLPRRLTRLLAGGWSTPTEATASDFGLYPVGVVPPPDADHRMTVTNTVPGVFTQTWTFSQEAQDARLAAEDRAAKGAAVDQAVAALRQWATDTDQTNAVQRLSIFFDRFADLIESDKL